MKHIKDLQRQEEIHRLYGQHVHQTKDFREAWRIFRIMAELVEGYQFLRGLEREVTILGSARFTPDNTYYQTAQALGSLLGANGYTTITGGGPGIMEAANKGAKEAGGSSIGLNIELPFEQVINPYVTESTSFNYFFTRKVMLVSPANAFVFFPGGFGTLDEFFEVVDLIEQGDMPHVPIVLVGKDFWYPIVNFVYNSCELGATDRSFVDSWHVVDTAKEAYEIIEQANFEPIDCDLSPNNFHCDTNIDWKLFRVMSELVEGFDFISHMPTGVTVLGTKSLRPQDDMYLDAQDIGATLATIGYSVITGGLQGIGQAANQGAFEVGGNSLGMGMKKGNKTLLNPYLNKSMTFQFPFTRKLMVTAPTEAFVVFPGGFGTFHQLFEILTLMQTEKLPKRPIVLYGRSFWEPIHHFIKDTMYHDIATISDEDDELYQIVDDHDSAIKVIQDTRANHQ